MFRIHLHRQRGLYTGATGGDSPENKGLAAFINSKANSAAGAKLYIDFHSYGLYFMGREYAQSVSDQFTSDESC